MTTTVGERIAYLRERRGLSQEKMAKELNIGQSTLAMWEKNKRGLKDEVIIMLSNYFNVSSDYLLGRTSSSNQELISDDLNDVLDIMKSFGGKTMTDRDKETIRAYLEGKFSDK